MEWMKALDEISWSAYLVTAAIVLAAYYLTVGLLYYKKEIRSLLSGKKALPGLNEVKDEGADKADGDGAFEELEAVVLDLRGNILEKAGKEVGKEELLTRLSLRLINYGGLRKPAFRVAVNHFIIEHAKELCGVAFSEEELNEAWDALHRRGDKADG